MPPLHRLLQRQLKRYIPTPGSIPDEWTPLLAAISDAYEEFDTGRRMLERELEISSRELFLTNSELRGVLEALPDVLFRIDESGTIIDLRLRTTAPLFGCEVDANGAPGAAAQQFRDAIPAVHGSQAPVSFEYDCRTTGRQLSYEARLVRFGDREIIGIVRDITERKQAEEALLVSRADLLQANTQLTAANVALHDAHRAAEAASEAKGAFLAHMSHEIRTPMNGIIGMTGLALATQLTAEQRSFLDAVQYSGESLLGIINDILDFSKIEAGKFDLDCHPFSIRASIDAALTLVSTAAAQKGLRVESRVDPGVPDLVNGDAGRLRQVLINLLGNAVKFTSSGEITISVNVDAQEEAGSLVHFAVRDMGIGISEAQQGRIFNAFEQAEHSTTRTYGGTGLGLVISRRLVEMMSGRIWVESTPGAGSTFHFTALLGLAATVDQPDPRFTIATPDASPGDGRKLRILLAEDNIVNQRVAVALLQKLGHTVVVANDGRRALECLGRETFDLVFMDVLMPEMDGLIATAAIRANERITGEHIRIVAMTANAMKGDRERCLAGGMDDYISKPIVLQELARASS